MITQFWGAVPTLFAEFVILMLGQVGLPDSWDRGSEKDVKQAECPKHPAVA